MQVFAKTFRERRSWAAVYRAFFRVYCLQLVAFHLLMAVAFVGWDLDVLSSIVVTHAWLSALERMANWWMTRRWVFGWLVDRWADDTGLAGWGGGQRQVASGGIRACALYAVMMDNKAWVVGQLMHARPKRGMCHPVPVSVT